MGKGEGERLTSSHMPRFAITPVGLLGMYKILPVDRKDLLLASLVPSGHSLNRVQLLLVLVLAADRELLVTSKTPTEDLLARVPLVILLRLDVAKATKKKEIIMS